MKYSLTYLFILFFFSFSAAQNTAETALSADFRQYLTDNNLWEQWRTNRNRFACPKEIIKETIPIPTADYYTIKLKKEDSVTVENILKTQEPLPYTDLPLAALAFGIEQRAKSYLRKQQLDSTFFGRMGLNVLEVLRRFPPSLQMRRKIIVTDITASMSPYAEQVLLWLEMELAKGQHTQFVFFNDGDRKYEEDKSIGATGGLYLAEGNSDSLMSVLDQMQRGMKAGTGGATPENDMEGILAGQARWDSTSQSIILIADGTSPVRDLSLIRQLKAPVHIVLCGVNSIYNEKGKMMVLLDYLLIAYMTGGSVHTIRQDLWSVDSWLEGKIVYLDAKPYLMEKRTLRQITRAEAEQRLQYKKS